VKGGRGGNGFTSIFYDHQMPRTVASRLRRGVTMVDIYFSSTLYDETSRAYTSAAGVKPITACLAARRADESGTDDPRLPLQ